MDRIQRNNRESVKGARWGDTRYLFKTDFSQYMSGYRVGAGGGGVQIPLKKSLEPRINKKTRVVQDHLSYI